MFFSNVIFETYSHTSFRFVNDTTKTEIKKLRHYVKKNFHTMNDKVSDKHK